MGGGGREALKGPLFPLEAALQADTGQGQGWRGRRARAAGQAAKTRLGKLSTRSLLSLSATIPCPGRGRGADCYPWCGGPVGRTPGCPSLPLWASLHLGHFPACTHRLGQAPGNPSSSVPAPDSPEQGSLPSQPGPAEQAADAQGSGALGCPGTLPPPLCWLAPRGPGVFSQLPGGDGLGRRPQFIVIGAEDLGLRR